ncbi:cell wall hydrolase/autolysin [Thalassoporum mexicanum PCC 7367]|uniref:N-acetylmuramoyl-L-alanine amidase n=1 Tax=Thalassoporum mexicanum TaxID=3457544 RepID=UPI00029FB96F|nr:N-acetylmuramoyl-L-alanine amidase [Pseudanabaena sp. PCC 7367]AFY69397.1 cell wall hydrolase/autolysin [Pseudanabaena sp. PCC 7367]
MGLSSRPDPFKRSPQGSPKRATGHNYRIQRRRLLQTGAGLLLASLTSNCAEPIAHHPGRQIFVSAGHGGFDARFRNPGARAGGTTEAAEMIVTKDLIAKELRSRGFRVALPDDQLSLPETVSWINNRGSYRDLAIEIHMGAYDNASLRGVRVYYISFNEERQQHAELMLESLLIGVPQLASRGIKPDSATALGRLAFCRDIAPRSLFIELGFISNPTDLRLLQTYRRNIAIAIADALDTIISGKMILPSVAEDLPSPDYYENPTINPEIISQAEPERVKQLSDRSSREPEQNPQQNLEGAIDASDTSDISNISDINAADQANQTEPDSKNLNQADLDRSEQLSSITREPSEFGDRPRNQPTQPNSRGLVDKYQYLKIIINNKPYPRPGILVNGNVYVPEDMAAYLGIAAKHIQNMQRLSYAHEKYLRALELRNFNLSLYWDGANNTVIVKTTYRIWLGQIDRIMGQGLTSATQLLSFLRQNNDLALREFANLPNVYREEAAIEGINHDIAFCQMCLETGFLRFGGDVEPQQNNFAGLGAIELGNGGDRFPTIRIGIRAHVQHLKAYASTEPLVQPLVDSRFRFVIRGTAPLVGQLSGRWAVDPFYAEKIMAILRYLYESSGIL